MATSSAPSLCYAVLPALKPGTRLSVQVRARSYGDDGRSSNMVDANLRILRERIEEVSIKERLESCYQRGHGWNYVPAYDCKPRRCAENSKLFELFGLAIGTFGLTIATASLCLLLVSLLIGSSLSMN
ncbi:uncharacterized protein LOC127804678 [Diospyros lotus]|uniref:uncharacterized protein LOC127804678 n=1 Tax=Diospyros lotus TaxID=55363 RepID=UPI002253A4C4|nr:uncharacterized protein LOC127804678 [Diospyros lotus]